MDDSWRPYIASSITVAIIFTWSFIQESASKYCARRGQPWRGFRYLIGYHLGALWASRSRARKQLLHNR